jgi:hypothetical protein
MGAFLCYRVLLLSMRGVTLRYLVLACVSQGDAIRRGLRCGADWCAQHVGDTVRVAVIDEERVRIYDRCGNRQALEDEWKVRRYGKLQGL